MVGPLPTDVGGSYTTGVCKVVYELSRQSYDGVELYISSTNIHQYKAEKISNYLYQYNGYRWVIFDAFCDILFHPIKTIRELLYHKNVCHQKNPFRFEFYKLNIIRHIKRVKPDILHVHSTECASVYFANNGKLPIIDTMHGVFYFGHESQKNMGDFLKSCVQQSDVITGLSENCRKLMKKYLNVPDNKLAIIPNGVDLSVYYFSERQRLKIRETYKVGQSTVFITVASIQERKGQLRFIKLLETLNIDYQYWIIGSGPDKVQIQKFCERKGISAKVKFLGSIPSQELYKYYSAADIYAHPSKMEGQALSEMEAYATGLRIIVSKDIKDTIASDVSNRLIYYVVDMDCVDANNIKMWLRNCPIKRTSRNELSWETVAKQYENLYKTLYNKNK